MPDLLLIVTLASGRSVPVHSLEFTSGDEIEYSGPFYASRTLRTGGAFRVEGPMRVEVRARRGASPIAVQEGQVLTVDHDGFTLVKPGITRRVFSFEHAPHASVALRPSS